MRTQRTALGVVAALVAALVYGQNGQSDVASVLAMKDDTAKVLKLSDLCFTYRRVNGDSALLFGKAARDLARRLNYARGEAQACNDMAIIHIDRSAFGQADSVLQDALRIRTELHDSAGIGAIYNKLGNVYQSQGLFEEALAVNLEALLIFERIGPLAKEGIILNNIAIIQANLRRYGDALATHESALALHERSGNAQGVAESQGNMANVLLAMGDTDRAMVRLRSAAGYFREHDMKRELAIQLNNMAGVLFERNKLDSAETLYREALDMRTMVGEKKAIASTLNGLSNVLLRRGGSSEARALLLRALSLSSEVGARNERMQTLLGLARLHAEPDHGDSAFWYHEQYTALRDSLFNEDMSKQLAEMGARYGSERKEREIQRQRADLAALSARSERRKFWLALLGGVAGAVLLVALLLLQVQRRRASATRDAAVITERERGLRHLVESTETERQRIAAELHDGVGQQISGLRFRLEDAASRDASLADLLAIADDASKEVRGLAHRMMPRALTSQGVAPAIDDMLQKALSRPDIRYSFETYGLGERLPQPMETGVYRIAQELVNNVIKHAGASEVHVHLLRNKGYLVLMVEDNGRGLPAERRDDGFGMQGMQDRTRLLHGTLTFEAGPGRGTIATLRVPLDTTNMT